MLLNLLVSHGSPALLLTEVPAKDFLRSLGRQIDATEEHLLPLYVARAVGGAVCEHQHVSATYGFPRMDVFGFHARGEAT